MTEIRRLLPIGIEDFGEISQERFYYIDKTGWIKELLISPGKVRLFTRPRRFGKSLNMSMLRYFFEPDTNKRIFDGLQIAREEELCRAYMGKYPVIAVSLKDMSGGSYDMAMDMTGSIIREEVRRHQYLLKSSILTDQEKDIFHTLLCGKMNESQICCRCTAGEGVCKWIL